MQNEDDKPTRNALAMKYEEVDLVTRSAVQSGLPYLKYKQSLRHDFFFSCAYCTMAESEAAGIRFTIDHYEPKSSFPDLENEYSNLMYACNECNIRKGPRFVPPEAKRDGIRFFRPDEDKFFEHFERIGIRLKNLSKIAEFTSDALDLNRQGLRRLREIRARLSQCEEMITAGIRSLRKFRIDQLPQDIRKRAMDAVGQLSEAEEIGRERLNDILREHAKSELIDDDPGAEVQNRARLKRLRGTEALYPGIRWNHNSKST